MKVESKIRNYIIDGKYDKLKSYIKKKSINICEYTFLSGDTLLHISCQSGDDLITKYLLKNGLILYTENNSKITPLDNLVTFVNKNKYTQRSKVKDILNVVMLYLDHQEAIFYNLIDAYNKLQEAYRDVKSTEFLDSDSDSSTSDVFNDLFDLYNEDFFDEIFGQNTKNYDYFESFKDTQTNDWDKWADDVSQSYWRKHKAPPTQHHSQSYRMKHKTPPTQNHSQSHRSKHEAPPTHQHTHEEHQPHGSSHPKQDNKKRKQEIPRISPSKVRRFNENQKLEFAEKRRAERVKHEVACAAFFSDCGNAKSAIRYRDIPWPFGPGGSAKEFLLGGVLPDSAEFKEIVKRNRVRWHVDRFLNRVGHRLDERDRATIVGKVTEISQILNDVAAKEL